EPALPAASATATPITVSAPVALGPVVRARRTPGGGPGATSARAAAAAAAAATNAHRQPTVRATAGTDTPASRVAAGMAACLTPNDSPCRRAGTRDSAALAASWPRELALAPAASSATSAAYERAASAIA